MESAQCLNYFKFQTQNKIANSSLSYPMQEYAMYKAQSWQDYIEITRSRTIPDKVDVGVDVSLNPFSWRKS